MKTKDEVNMVMMIWSVIGVSLALMAPRVGAETITGIVVSVADGDTITVLQAQRQYKIQLLGIDCPESRQNFGQVAKQYTAEQVFGRPVSVVTSGKDWDGRWIGVVILHDGRVLNHTLVDEGLCFFYRTYSSDPVLDTLETQAKSAKRGVWIDPNPVKPWEFRKTLKVKTGS